MIADYFSFKWWQVFFYLAQNREDYAIIKIIYAPVAFPLPDYWKQKRLQLRHHLESLGEYNHYYHHQKPPEHMRILWLPAETINDALKMAPTYIHESLKEDVAIIRYPAGQDAHSNHPSLGTCPGSSSPGADYEWCQESKTDRGLNHPAPDL